MDDGPAGPLKRDETDAPPSVFDMILDHIPDGICLQDIYGRVEWINPAVEIMFGWSLEEARGRHARDLFTTVGSSADGTRSRKFIYDFSSSIFKRIIVKQFQRRNGSCFWLQQNFAVLDLGPTDQQKKIVITCQDVSDQINTDNKLRQVHANLEHAANHDDLTGLANRKKLDRYLKSGKVADAIRSRSIGVLQFDIDKFKDINDTLGHAAGDATLRHVAAALRRNSGRGNLACRTGGDEFLLIYLNAGNPVTLKQRAEAVLEEISAPMSWKGQELRIGSSIGASVAKSPKDTGEDLILRADRALYFAKQSGRGQVALYDDAMGQKYRAQMKMASELKEAIEQQQFDVFLQPQLHLPSGLVTGCEALIRWNHPERGLLSPGQFLAAAETAGHAAEIDYISMGLSLDALVELRKKGFPDLQMSINVCSSILGDSNYPGLLNWALQSRDIDPGNICIEVLETTILDGGNLEIATAVERLKRLGVRIALDDFGTGYAGLSHMASFDVDVIKLDRSMISRLENDPRNRMVVRSIIRLCDLLNISVVAEGVETNTQLEILRRARCPLIQGYGLARPMPLAETLDWLNKGTHRSTPLAFAPKPKADTIPLIAATQSRVAGNTNMPIDRP